ncbi:hypothetical protein [Mycoplasma todarodis]|uniref:hypothetical protein n=1 Tax=Mycoplasma todarodis TaxID=1937191 RepID=UPI003B2C3D4F
MSRKNFLIWTITFTSLAFIASSLFLIPAFANLVNAKVEENLIFYVGSIASLISTFSLIRLRKKVINKSWKSSIGIFYSILMYFYLGINASAIGIPIIISLGWIKSNNQYPFLIILVLSSLTWMWTALSEGNDENNWIVFLFQKPGLYDKTIEHFSKLEKNLNLKVLNGIKGKINANNYKNIEKNLRLIDFEFDIDFYIELYVSAKVEEREFIIYLNPSIQNSIGKVLSLDIKWIKTNKTKNKKFIKLCLEEMKVAQRLVKSFEFYTSEEVEFDDNLLNFIFNFPKKFNDMMLQIVANIENNASYIGYDIVRIKDLCNSYSITDDEVSKIKQAIRVIIAKSEPTYDKKIIDIIMDNWKQWEVIEQQLLEYFIDMRS